MEYYSYLRHPICQIYADQRQCRSALLKLIGFPAGNDLSFSDFVEDLIADLISFPTNDRGLVRQQVYRYFEICQTYA